MSAQICIFGGNKNSGDREAAEIYILKNISFDQRAVAMFNAGQAKELWNLSSEHHHMWAQLRASGDFAEANKNLRKGQILSIAHQYLDQWLPEFLSGRFLIGSRPARGPGGMALHGEPGEPAALLATVSMWIDWYNGRGAK